MSFHGPAVVPMDVHMPLDAQHAIFVDSSQGTHCAFMCTFVPSDKFPVVSEIPVKAVLGEAQPAHLFSNREWQAIGVLV